ncbi:DUF2147 domain-containing protein [Sphingomonas sp. LM7]|uniref:DUF2147 domain-containing protein n=1 Tax=Sphingomonas sp. LM7 TaxID=1938607 RepID=UPI0009840658|nr:DUF2147 domain-containing protein [Sphingomonas sp. LM7]AQR74267.1 hypothetical protein BXU08_11950 [Sphingomonas sp. LM7]
MLLTLIGLSAAMAAPQNADAVVGRWRTETRGGIVEIQRCGASICGRVLTSDLLRTNPNLKDAKNANAALRNRPLRGLQILGGFSVSGNGWTGGKIYNAEDGKTYSADVTPSGADQLKLRGCVFKPFCKTQTWTRIR